MVNAILQFFGLDLVNINVSANIPNGLRVMGIFRKLSGDKIKCLIIGHTLKVNLKVSVDFLRVVQFQLHYSVSDL